MLKKASLIFFASVFIYVTVRRMVSTNHSNDLFSYLPVIGPKYLNESIITHIVFAFID